MAVQLCALHVTEDLQKELAATCRVVADLEQQLANVKLQASTDLKQFQAAQRQTKECVFQTSEEARQKGEEAKRKFEAAYAQLRIQQEADRTSLTNVIDDLKEQLFDAERHAESARQQGRDAERSLFEEKLAQIVAEREELTRDRGLLESGRDALRLEMRHVRRQAEVFTLEKVCLLSEGEQLRAQILATRDAALAERNQAQSVMKHLVEEKANLQEEICRLMAVVGSLQRLRGVGSAVVSSSSPLVIGVEAEDVDAVRGDATARFATSLADMCARQAYCIGRVLLGAGGSSPPTVPVCSNVFVLNDGPAIWAESAVLCIVEGESFGAPLVPVGAVKPGRSIELQLELTLPLNRRIGVQNSVWALLEPITGHKLGPLVVLEVEWTQQRCL